MDKNKDGLALVVGGLFILALVFATYNYFNKSSSKELSSEVNVQKTEENKEEGDINGEGVSTSEESATQETFMVQNGEQTVESAFYWVANDYNEGDISGDTYTVKAGDTLWEIAEAVYGNGGDWYKLRDANLDAVSFLPNGQQSLIVEGQVLVIPQ